MIARLYSNENFPLPAVHELRAHGHDVLTSHEAGQANKAITDEEVLSFAIANGRAVLTHNRQHFIRSISSIQTMKASSSAPTTPISPRLQPELTRGFKQSHC